MVLRHRNQTFYFVFVPNKVAARKSAIEAGLPVIPGTDDAVLNAEEALEFVTQHGVPVIFKATLN